MSTVALTIGTFDTPHLGHAHLFRQAIRLADELIVGVNSDDFVEQYKGARPVFTVNQRRGFIKALGYRTMINHSAGRELIEQLQYPFQQINGEFRRTEQPTFLVIGSDWANRDYLKQIDVTVEFLESYPLTLVYVPRIPGLSSTVVKASVKG